MIDTNVINQSKGQALGPPHRGDHYHYVSNDVQNFPSLSYLTIEQQMHIYRVNKEFHHNLTLSLIVTSNQLRVELHVRHHFCKLDVLCPSKTLSSGNCLHDLPDVDILLCTFRFISREYRLFFFILGEEDLLRPVHEN